MLGRGRRRGTEETEAFGCRRLEGCQSGKTTVCDEDSREQMMLSCVNMTPLGFPVDPEVYWTDDQHYVDAETAGTYHDTI